MNKPRITFELDYRSKERHLPLDLQKVAVVDRRHLDALQRHLSELQGNKV